jgi:hypothetical protein
MRIFRFLINLIVALSLAVPIWAQTGGEPDGFSVALSDYYGYSVEDVTAIKEMGIGDDDLAVTLLVANLVKTSPENIAKTRARGDSWNDIAKIRSVDANSFYMVINGKFESKTFTPIFEKYRQTSKSKWGDILLTDDDVANLVNLKFISSHHDYSAFTIMEMRDNEYSYREIDTKVRAAKEEMEKEQKIKAREAAKKEAEGEGKDKKN